MANKQLLGIHVYVLEFMFLSTLFLFKFPDSNEKMRVDMDFFKMQTQLQMKTMHLSSPAFKNQNTIPAQYTCDGKNVNPALEIPDVPKGAKCLALIVDDPDAPVGTWVHWVVWNIPITARIEENSIPGVQGVNDFQQHKYGGPCPPSGTHRYFFKIYALDTFLELPESTSKTQLEHAMKKHILAQGELIGTYKRRT